MAFAGDTLTNPVLRHQGKFLRTAADTSGDLLEIEFRVGPGGPQLQRHIHRLQKEDFEVLEGSIRYWIGREQTDRVRGQRIAVPPGTSHSFANVTGLRLAFV